MTFMNKLKCFLDSAFVGFNLTNFASNIFMFLLYLVVYALSPQTAVGIAIAILTIALGLLLFYPEFVELNKTLRKTKKSPIELALNRLWGYLFVTLFTLGGHYFVVGYMLTTFFFGTLRNKMN